MSEIELAQEVRVDDDLRKKAQDDANDCRMVTVLQPAEMLKSEISLHDAARKNSVERVKRLISDKVDVNSRNNLDRTALMWASANGHLEVMDMLINAGAEVEAQDKYGMRALLWAAWFGQKEAMLMLVNNGANIHCTNKQGLNMLHCASQNNHTDIIHFIFESLEGYDIDEREKEEETFGIFSKKPKVTNRKREAKVSAKQKQLQANERTALHLAAENGHLEAVEKLLDHKCDIGVKDKLGQTPVHLAALQGNVEVVRKLLFIGFEVDDRDLEGKTALHIAAESGNVEVVDLLLTSNSDPNTETTKEMTPIHLAALHGHKDVLSSLVEFGCNINAQNYQGNTSLHLSTIANYPLAVQYLVDTGCELDLPNHRLQTPLHCAVENGLCDVVEILLIAGASLEAMEKTGKNALWLASRGSFIGIVDMIIKADRYYAIKKITEKLREEEEMKEEASNNFVVQFKKSNHEYLDYMKGILWKLSTKQLKSNEWKRLAYHWRFSESHIRAIEHQYTGPQSWREHGYRMCLIWLHGVKKDENPTRLLFEALVSIGRKHLAEQIRRKTNLQTEKPSSPKLCLLS